MFNTSEREICASENLFRLNLENLGFQGPLHKFVQEKTPTFLLNREYNLAVQHSTDRQSTSLRLNDYNFRALFISTLDQIKKKKRRM